MKLLKRFTLITLLCLLIPAMVYAGATFSRSKTWSAAETLTASDLNAEFDNILNNLTPTGIDDESASDVAAQATSDPYPGTSLSKATSLKGEIQQIRYLLKQLTGESYWYVDPDLDMVTLATHKARHISAGADEIDGDQLDIDWNPTYYTPAVTPSQVTTVDHLTAHLYGIDLTFNNKAASGANSDITSMTGLSDDGIPVAKVANAASDGANSDITSMTGLSNDGIPLAKVANAASDGANSDITSMTGLDNDGIPVAKVDGAIETASLAASTLTDKAVVRGDGGTRGVKTSTMIISDNGEMTNPSQPAFLVTANGAQTDIAVGDAVTILWQNEIKDQNSDFASNAFTAPVTGMYLLIATLDLESIDFAANSHNLGIITSNRSYRQYLMPQNFTADMSKGVTLVVLADMDAADTAHVTWLQGSGTQQEDILATLSTFSGGLLF